jgi:molybdopterin synthase sulfur carrier subunit
VSEAGAVTLLYFAWVRERIGTAEERVDIAGPMALGALVDRLQGMSAGHAAALEARGRLRAAINQQFVGWEAEVRPGDEVALFPPVTGG